MANTIKIKRSAVPAKVPTTSDLALGELALNTYDGKLYTKKDNGTASVVELSGGGASVTTSDTAPVSPSDGDLWYDSVSGRLYVYYDDGSSSQWVDAAPQGGGGDLVEIDGGSAVTIYTPGSFASIDGGNA